MTDGRPTRYWTRYKPDPGVEWRPIEGFENYLVSDDGRVYSVRARLELKGGIDKGYKQVNLSKNNRLTCFRRHRLVARAFLPDAYFPGAHVRHLDGNRLNNHVSNLAWGTPSENMQDRLRHGTNPNASKTHCKWGHEFTPENTYPRDGLRQCLACKKARSNLRNQRPEVRAANNERNRRSRKPRTAEQKQAKNAAARQARRANGLRSNAAKTECHRGHPFDDANTYVTSKGMRQCKACKRLQQAGVKRVRNLSPEQKARKADNQRRWRAQRGGGNG